MDIFNNPYADYYQQSGEKWGVPPDLLMIQGYYESGFKNVTSSKKASGVAQFIPSTAKQYGVNVNDPQSSIDGQAHYMSDLFQKFGNWKDALIAYNGGSSAVDYLKNGAGSYAYDKPDKSKPSNLWVNQTSDYANKIMNMFLDKNDSVKTRDGVNVKASSPTSDTNTNTTSKNDTKNDSFFSGLTDYFDSKSSSVMDFIKKGAAVLFGAMLLIFGFWRLIK